MTPGKTNAKGNIILGKIENWRDLEDFIKGEARERDTSIEKLKARGVLFQNEIKPEKVKWTPTINNVNNETKDDNEEDNDQNPRKIIASIKKIIVLTNETKKIYK